MPELCHAPGTTCVSSPGTGVAASRILLVDDDALIRELVGQQLAMFGYDVDSVAGAREALFELSDRRYDLVITDWHMGDVDGCDLVRELRKIGHALPILMYSGWLDQEALPADVAAEVAATVQKPARAEQLLAAIEHALGKTAQP